MTMKEGQLYEVPRRDCGNGKWEYVLKGELLEKFCEYYPMHRARETAMAFGISEDACYHLARKNKVKRDRASIMQNLVESIRKAHARRRADKESFDQFRKECSDRHKAIIARDRMRVELGMPQVHKFHLPFANYTHKQIQCRRNMRKRNGYVPGDCHSESERWNIYYTPETVRSARMERHAEALHFRVKPLGVKETVVPEARAGNYFEIMQ